MPIAPLPALDRTSPTFKADLDDFFLTELPAFSVEAEAARVEINEGVELVTDSVVLVELAAAAANYKGLWSALTGALNMPASVAHNGNYWALNANLADVTAATPGVSASWQPLAVGAGGATETSSAVDVTLTAASYRVQAVAMTATGKSVNLPNATTLATGSDIFVIKNTGTTVFCVRDSAGTLIAAVDPGITVTVALVNASTSAGVWVATGAEDSIYQATAVAVNAAVGHSVCIAPLTATTALAVWSAGGVLTAVVLTVAGTTVTVGTIFTGSSIIIGNPPRMRVTAMSATQVIVAYTSTPSSYAAAVTLNISAGIVTAGTPLVFGTAATTYQDVTTMGSTQALCTYKGTTGYAYARTLNVSGTTITAGAALTVMASTSGMGTVTAISATQAICTANSSSVLSYAYLLTVSGTDVTAGASPAQIAATAALHSACKVSATQVLVLLGGYATIAPPRYALLGVSGATVAINDVMDGVGNFNNGCTGLVRVSAAKFMAAFFPAGGASGFEKAVVQVVNVADSALRIVEPKVTIKNAAESITNYTADLVSISATNQLAVYHDSSGYIQARILEIAA